MTRVFIIRHAEAEGNLYRRGHGHFDSKITPRGRRQIEKLAERFRHERIDALYSSDLIRAVDTAGAILKYQDLELNLSDRLREINMGCWEDMSWGDIAHYHGEMLYKFNFDPDKWSVPGAESFSHLKRRISSAVRELASTHEGQTVAVVSHGMAIRSLLCELLNTDINDYERVPHADNTAVSLLEINNDGKVNDVYLNDTEHLTEGLSTFATQTWFKKTSPVDIGSLRFEPLDPYLDAALYTSCYADTWRETHNTLRGFEPSHYLTLARERASRDNEALFKAYSGDALAGILELDPNRGRGEGYGWIPLCYMLSEFRGSGLGIQLIGHAVSVFRRIGRDRIRLHVAKTNGRAVKFYENCEFSEIGRERGTLCELLIMEKII